MAPGPTSIITTSCIAIFGLFGGPELWKLAHPHDDKGLPDMPSDVLRVQDSLSTSAQIVQPVAHVDPPRDKPSLGKEAESVSPQPKAKEVLPPTTTTSTTSTPKIAAKETAKPKADTPKATSTPIPVPDDSPTKMPFKGDIHPTKETSDLIGLLRAYGAGDRSADSFQTLQRDGWASMDIFLKNLKNVDSFESLVAQMPNMSPWAALLVVIPLLIDLWLIRLCARRLRKGDESSDQSQTQTDKNGSKLKKKRKSKGGPDLPEHGYCPQGHELKEYATVGGNCDGCKNKCVKGELVMDCRLCNWYLCEHCFKKAPRKDSAYSTDGGSASDSAAPKSKPKRKDSANSSGGGASSAEEALTAPKTPRSAKAEAEAAEEDALVDDAAADAAKAKVKADRAAKYASKEPKRAKAFVKDFGVQGS